MSQGIRRLRKFASPKLRQNFNAKRRTGQPVFHNARERYARFIEIPDDAEVQAAINKASAQQLEDFNAPYAFERALFLASDEPQAKKDRVDDFVPPPQPRFHLEINDLIKAEVNDATESFRNTLYPTEWAKQKLALVKPQDPDYQYWQNVLSDVNEEDDRAYEAEIQDTVESFREDYGDDDASGIAQEARSARNNAQQNFDAKVKEIRSVTEEARRQVEQIAQQNIQRGGSKSLWESKIAQADYLSRNDARLQDVFRKAMPKSLERKVNTRTFELFGVDKNFIQQYKEHNRIINQKEHEKQAASEELEHQAASWVERYNAHQAESNKYVEQHNAYVDWYNSKQETMTPGEFFHTHPKIWAWVEWRLAHYRIDFEKTDETYARQNAHDYLYWPLPRNP
eukprot:TRINITY_DN22095_c0_g1_i1.p1 TRINITY_DN22095_c0_g1~~TRINITY_DN22095_c0_g1_i1.p1  ORF type:complete len:433 (-),score=121.20 TRINITY_DN22095_c0_g1_i1:66-1256(-)